MAKKQKWSKGIDIKEGALTKMGWPNSSKLVEAARGNRKLVVSRLNYLANITKDASTKSKARGIIKRIQRELGE